MSNIKLLSTIINISELLNMIEQSYAFLCLNEEDKISINEEAAKKCLKYVDITIIKAKLIFSDIYNKYIKKQLEKECNYKIIDNYFQANQENNFLTNLNNLFEMIVGVFDIDMALYVLNDENNEKYIKAVYEKNKDIILKQGVEVISKNNILITLIEAYCSKNNIDLNSDELINIDSSEYHEQKNNQYKSNSDIYDENAYTQYCKLIPNNTLTAEEEIDLAHKIKNGDKKAEEKFIKHNLRLVISIAKRYQGNKIPLLDLIQEGNIGLTKAVKKFDPDKYCKFSTYANWWIRESILRYIYNTKEIIRIPEQKKAQIVKLNNCIDKMQLILGENFTIEQIAEEMGISVNKVKELMETRFEIISYDAPIGDNNNNPLQEILVIPDEVSIEDEADSIILNDQLKSIMAEVLDKREYDVICHHFGILNNVPISLEEVGKIFNITRERVRQIEAKALRKLRKHLSNQYLVSDLNKAKNNNESELNTSIKKNVEKQQIKLEDKEILWLLKLMTDDEKLIIKEVLGDNYYNILIRKFGKEYQGITYLSLKEEKICNTEIYPFVRKLLQKYRGYFYYKQLFKIRDEALMMEAFCSLTLSDQKTLIDFYGKDLNNCIRAVSKEKINLLIKVSRKLKAYTPSNNLNNLKNSLKVFNDSKNYSLYNISQNFNTLFGEVYNNEIYVNMEFLDYRVLSNVQESLKNILKAILNKNEYEVIKLFYGLDNNIYLNKATIAQKLNKSDKKIDELFNKAIIKLRISPYLQVIYNSLYKNTKRTTVNLNNNSVNLEAGIINFYSFFTPLENKYLDFAIRKLSADELLILYEIFKDGLETGIVFSSISEDNQKSINNIVVKLKTIIMNSRDINLRKVFNICRYLYSDLVFEIVCYGLDYEERDIFDKVIKCVEQNIEPIEYISKNYNINKKELVSNLKIILEKLLKRLELLQQQNNLVRKLIKDNNVKVGNEYE